MGWFSEATPPQKQAPIAPPDLRARAALAAPDNDIDIQELLYLVAPLVARITELEALTLSQAQRILEQSELLSRRAEVSG